MARGYRERKLTLEVEVVLTEGTLSGLGCCLWWDEVTAVRLVLKHALWE